ncbi:hypothetical protein T01_14243, partial [Trichinella spiralis]
LLRRLCQPSKWLLVQVFTLCTFQGGCLSSVLS